MDSRCGDLGGNSGALRGSACDGGDHGLSRWRSCVLAVTDSHDDFARPGERAHLLSRCSADAFGGGEWRGFSAGSDGDSFDPLAAAGHYQAGEPYGAEGYADVRQLPLLLRRWKDVRDGYRRAGE